MNTKLQGMDLLNYDLGKCYAHKRAHSQSSMNCYTPFRRNSVSNTTLLSGLSTVILPRENKASQRRRELSETLQRKWSIEDEMNFKYYNQLNNRARRLSQTQPQSKSSRSTSQLTMSSKDSPRSVSTPPGGRSLKHRQPLNGAYMEEMNVGTEMVYLTPLQRKEKHIKELKADLREKEVALELMEEELNSVLSEKNPELHSTLQTKNIEIENLGDALSLMEQKYADLELKYQILDETVEQGQKATDNLKKELHAREDKHQEQMVQMFKKGQQASHAEQLGQMSNNEQTRELQQKLTETEQELLRLRTMQRKKNKRTESDITESEAVTTLQFIRSSLFQYLTRDAREAGRHLKAMIGMMGFDEAQLENIAFAVENKKSKSS
ncbi:hypothetical protein LSAT2_021233 [Lamellibrachia satsuma]|nr:hypothetical protein LSAT2_021233 [Lamellibrachia satsuma]